MFRIRGWKKDDWIRLVVIAFAWGPGVAWCIFVFVMASLNVGETSSSSIYTWVDVFGLMVVGVLFPFSLGVITRAYDKRYFEETGLNKEE